MEFIGTILTIILGFYLFGFIAKFLLRIWLAKKVRDFQNGGGGFQNMGGGFYTNSNHNRQQSSTTKQDGEVTITAQTKKDRNIDKSIGEYVEFDEVKE